MRKKHTPHAVIALAVKALHGRLRNDTLEELLLYIPEPTPTQRAHIDKVLGRGFAKRIRAQVSRGKRKR